MLTPQGTWNESLPFFVPIRSTLVLLLECDIHRLALRRNFRQTPDIPAARP